jgi:hypothetical protein
MKFHNSIKNKIKHNLDIIDINKSLSNADKDRLASDQEA